MTEAEWLGCDKSYAMVQFVQTSGSASPRKLRLFAVACCRRIGQCLKDEGSQRLVEVAERFADRRASPADLAAAFEEAANAQKGIHHSGGDAGDESAAEAVLGLRHPLLLDQVFDGINEAVGETEAAKEWDRIYGSPGKHWSVQEREHREACEAGEAIESTAQAVLLRDIFGPLPFRDTHIPASVLAWNDGCVVKLATAIYDEREFTQERMGILADALEEAGLEDREVLSHCRQGGAVHVRGCWCVDLLLGKS
jgi:hypothetical protein